MVTITDTQAFTQEVKPGTYVKISLTDTGVGMDEKTLKRIFEPFFTTKELGRGTGLGLATVYGIVKGHGGFINAYSEVGIGTTFNIYLPATPGTVSPEQAAQDESIVRGTGTILLVDDEETVRATTQEMLDYLGYRVVTACDGDEAVALYRDIQGSIDLVVLDMILPGRSGKDTFIALQEINPGVRVILSSGYSLNGQATGIMALGCRAFMQKPFILAELSRKVRDVIAAP
jgi:CheY-like chemotaxis protein